MSMVLDLYIDQGADFLVMLPPVTTSAGLVQDLTGYSVTSQIRRSYASDYAVQLGAAITNTTSGLIQLSLPSLETVGLAPTRYVYDVLVTDMNGFVTKVFDGLMTVNPGVSNKPNTTLVTPYIPDDYGGW